jgi:hypothetical protein
MFQCFYRISKKHIFSKKLTNVILWWFTILLKADAFGQCWIGRAIRWLSVEVIGTNIESYSWKLLVRHNLWWQQPNGKPNRKITKSLLSPPGFFIKDFVNFFFGWMPLWLHKNISYILYSFFKNRILLYSSPPTRTYHKNLEEILFFKIWRICAIVSMKIPLSR